MVQETNWIESLPLQSHSIMEALSRRGHRVKVIDFEARSVSRSLVQSMKLRVFPNLCRTDSESSVCLIRPGMVKLPGIGRISSMLGQFKAIFEQAAKWCDVIVLYSVPTNGIQTVLSARFLDKPILFHSLDVLHGMTGYSFLRAPTWALERFVYLRVDKVVVISAALRRYMERIGVRPEQIILLAPAVNTQRFAPTVSGEGFRRELGITSREKLVLFSGWLYEFSGLDFLLNALSEVTSQSPDIRIVICGDGPLSDKLQEMLERLNLGRHVKIVGRRPYSEMPSVVAAADICINPYVPDIRGNFAFPSKIAEYMAAGKPVLATDLPGTRSILGEDSGVVLVPLEQFVPKLNALLDEDEFRIQAGRRCREFCVQNFSLEGVAKRFEAVLKDLVSESL